MTKRPTRDKQNKAEPDQPREWLTAETLNVEVDQGNYRWLPMDV